MAKWWLATYDEDYEIQYEPWSYKPRRRNCPDDEPWAIYDCNFFVVECSNDWGGVCGPLAQQKEGEDE